ncbi:TRAP transporter small permease [Sneathiella chinensis]|uniref:TRAP transporter small permease protein n=1 Tax=Sneathiella chinensis TaxID=349750 RepID=A0ABQ5U888_9PROT|nr:TRAP transporter small permease [Sneathiella chinensis]GLQ08011.1 hypothetical protein GCM10007924_32330 [Sneathiella chinensis]
MTDSSGHWLERIDSLWSKLENSLNFLAGFLVFILMFLGVIQIILRTVYRNPIYGYIDIVEVAMVGFAVLSISYVQRVGAHVRMELLISRISGRAHWIAEAISTALSIFIVAVLVPYSYNHFMRAFSFGDSTIDIQLPTWPAKLIIPVALGVLLVRLIIQMIGYLRLVKDPDAKPIAVPLIKDAETQAEEEIMHAEESLRENHADNQSIGGKN